MKQLIYFSAVWCQPCRMLSPVMEELQSEGYNVQKVDVDANPTLSQKYGVRNIPTVILAVNGEEIARKVGASPKKSYLDMYNQN
jgi:thioredoxin 1